MAERIDVVKLLEEPSEQLERQLKDPHSAYFKHETDPKVEIEPDFYGVKNAEADLANGNVKVWYTTQTKMDKYRTVISEPEISLVESQAFIDAGEYRGMSKLYYAVVDDRVLLHDADSFTYEETFNPRVREVAEITPELYRQAEEAWEEISPDPVPPPEKDSMFQD